jgi:sortase A
MAQLPQQDPAVSLPTTQPENEQGSPATQTPSPTPTDPLAEVPLEPEPQQVVTYAERPSLGDKIGTITLPTLDLSWPIFEGTTESQLSKGVGHFIGSVLPGVEDNSVLSGHRTTVFNRLGELSIGDLILVETSVGISSYQVARFRIVPRTDRTVIVPTPEAVLTLTTCYPFNHIGYTTDAFIVSANLIGFLPEAPSLAKRRERLETTSR